jgi:hypothetical protein
VKFVLPSRHKRGVYTVTDARRSMSEDISYRQRRYLISMGVRVVAFLLAVFLFHGVWRFIAAAIALVVPYFAVVFANGGREPDNAAAFEPFEPNLLERKEDAGGPPVPTDGAGADAAGGPTCAHDGTAHDGTAHDVTAHDGTAHDGTAHDGTAQRGNVQPGAARDGGPADGVAGGRTAGQGHTGWNAAAEETDVREGEAFMSGEQADTRF